MFSLDFLIVLGTNRFSRRFLFLVWRLCRPIKIQISFDLFYITLFIIKTTLFGRRFVKSRIVQLEEILNR